MDEGPSMGGRLGARISLEELGKLRWRAGRARNKRGLKYIETLKLNTSDIPQRDAVRIL